MKVEIGDSILELVEGDITKQETEAIVNAANKRLSPGGGVSGAIHDSAGPELWEECRELKGCESGEAKITKGYNLPSSYVIHTVGPVYSNSPRDPKLLSSSYRNSLELAEDYGIESISFPAISTGVFGYPEEDAAEVAIETVKDFLEEDTDIKTVRFVLFSRESLEAHEKVLRDLFPNVSS